VFTFSQVHHLHGRFDADARLVGKDRGRATMSSIWSMTRVKRLLCPGAHCDDIEIGAGGTIVRPAKAYPQIEVRCVILSREDPMRAEEARRSAEVFLSGTGKSEIPRRLSAVPG
jgi:hypothetical protein